MIEKPIYIQNQSHYRLKDVARAIADTFPSEPSNAKGIDCLTKKVLAPARLRFESNPNKKAQHLYLAKSFLQKSDLTNEDRKRLKLMLPILPEISHFMTTSDIEKFFDKYYEVQNRPTWEPDITSTNDRQMLKNDYDQRVICHCKNFLSKVTEGVFSAFDEKFTMLSGKEHDAQKIAFVTQGDVIKYFKLLNLELRFENIENSGETILDREILAEEKVSIAPARPSIDCNKSKKRKDKRDPLTQAIEDYQKEFFNIWTRMSMWIHFQKMAKNGEPPFIRCVDDRIYWTASAKSRGINRKALFARLDRQEEKANELNSELDNEIKTG